MTFTHKIAPHLHWFICTMIPCPNCMEKRQIFRIYTGAISFGGIDGFPLWGSPISLVTLVAYSIYQLNYICKCTSKNDNFHRYIPGTYAMHICCTSATWLAIPREQTRQSANNQPTITVPSLQFWGLKSHQFAGKLRLHAYTILQRRITIFQKLIDCSQRT